MKNRKLYDEVLTRYNQEQHTTISIKEDALGKLEVSIDLEEHTIHLHPHIETLFVLFNLSTVSRTDGNMAIHHFLLYHLAMGKNMYAKAEELLYLLQADLRRLMSAKKKNRLPLTDICMECQMIFLLMHEANHIYFHHHPEVRQMMKERLYRLRSELDNAPSLLLKLMYLLFPGLRGKMEHSFDEVKADPALQDELLCDDAAWRITSQHIKQNVPDAEQQAKLAAYTVYTLYYIEAQRTLENIFMTPDTAAREKDLLFYTSRSTVLTSVVWESIAPAHIRTFRSLVNAISRQDRVALMLPLRANVEHIAYIRLCPREKYSLKENLRLMKLYNETIGSLDG